MPFVNIMVNTDAKFRYCCVASGKSAILSNNDSALLVNDTSITEAWNSDTIVSARNDMLAGKTVAACSNCYKQEDIGKVSLRQMMTEEWKNRLGTDFDKIISEAESNNGRLSLPPVYLDLRLGNLCNLKCRMCNPFNSSQIAKEHFALYDSNSSYVDGWSKEFGSNPVHLKEDTNVFDGNFLWNEIISIIPHLKKVYLTGGEPTLIKNNYRFMEECISLGYNDNIELFFNINGSNVTDKFLSLISKFKKVKINCSIDGTGDVNDYIRSGSNWKKIDENFCKLANIPSVDLGVSPVLQVYNVLECVNTLEYVNSVAQRYNRRISVDFLINDHPTYLDATILPIGIRKTASTKLYEYSINTVFVDDITSNSVNGIISFLKKPQHDNYKMLLSRFKNITDAQDKKRNTNFSSMFPIIAKEINYEEL